MASVLAQERLLGLALGGTLAASVHVCLQRQIWRSTGSVVDSMAQFQKDVVPVKAMVDLPPPLFGEQPRTAIVRNWNLLLDTVTRPMVRLLSEKGL
ncbi:hypothetical protein CBR_g51663 [Chara braunii]|uniref:Uncharacterized protein n=1 Tax=Chara braunii TaxID=69332 RepID=A0A388M917_CHABU|nr:hypothetical protein CBR_g51663 [Chara braunii]|eukprot:GBG91005.1 hypothetical protein CBR_g51663 [Chara braunii]